MVFGGAMFLETENRLSWCRLQTLSDQPLVENLGVVDFYWTTVATPGWRQLEEQQCSKTDICLTTERSPFHKGISREGYYWLLQKNFTSMMMDFATLFELPVTKLYPWCDFSHCLLTAFQAKKDFQELHRYRTILYSPLTSSFPKQETSSDVPTPDHDPVFSGLPPYRSLSSAEPTRPPQSNRLRIQCERSVSSNWST